MVLPYVLPQVQSIAATLFAIHEVGNPPVRAPGGRGIDIDDRVAVLRMVLRVELEPKIRTCLDPGDQHHCRHCRYIFLGNCSDAAHWFTGYTFRLISSNIASVY